MIGQRLISFAHRRGRRSRWGYGLLRAGAWARGLQAGAGAGGCKKATDGGRGGRGGGAGVMQRPRAGLGVGWGRWGGGGVVVVVVVVVGQRVRVVGRRCFQDIYSFFSTPPPPLPSPRN